MGHGRHNDFAGNWMVYLSSLIGLMSDVCIHGARTDIVAHVPISAQADLHHYPAGLCSFNPLYSC